MFTCMFTCMLRNMHVTCMYLHACPILRDSTKMTALDWANKNSHVNVAEILSKIQKFGSRPYWVMTRARVMTEFLKIYNKYSGTFTRPGSRS
jgi:hypothetical protein